MSSCESKQESDAWNILAHLWQLTQSVLDESAPALEAIGLSPKAFFLLTIVEEHPFPAELARLMHLPPPTVTYLVKQMEAKGFLKRSAEPGDLRKFRLVLSAAGRRAIRQSRERIGRVLDTRLKRLDPDEISQFDRVVQRLAGN
jgi:DNA-binding MarR family transcriptional regulator